MNAAEPLGLAVLTPEQRLLFVDKGILELLGWEAETLLDRPLAGFLAEDQKARGQLWERMRNAPHLSLTLPLTLAGARGPIEVLASFYPLYGPQAIGYRLVVFYPPLSPALSPKGGLTGGGQTPAAASALLAALPDPVALLDRGCRLRAANRPLLEWIGADPEGWLGRPFAALCPDRALATFVYAHLTPCLNEGKAVVGGLRVLRQGGSSDYEVRLLPYRNDQGASEGLVVALKDMSELYRSEQQLAQAKAVYDSASEGILITDGAGIAIAVNPAFTRITGYAESEVLGQRPYLLNAQWHSRAFFIGLWRRLRKQGRWQGELWSRRKDGEIYRQRLTICRVLDRQGRVGNFVMVLADRTAPWGSIRPSDSLIHYDPLTRLPNRLLFELRLDHALAQRTRRGALLAVLLIDLDHFSHINASLGYRLGDELLRTVALKLREAIHPSDTLARLHADRFALLLEGLGEPEEATQLANRLRALMAEPIQVRGHELHISLSIGIALMTEQGEDAQGLMLKAELALRQVKRQGRNGFRVLTSPPPQLASGQRGWLGRLSAALERSEIHIRYRPGCDMSSGRLEVIEAAPYWSAVDLGVVTAERLWTLAEESGLVLELGDWLLAESCQQFARWIDRGLAPERLVIAISEAQCLRGNLLRSVERQLLAHPTLAKRLDLEFSERLLVKHCDALAMLFQGLNELGVGVWIGEAGLGWTAPALLQRLPVRALKIHASFIAALPHGPHELAVVEALIAMAQALGIEIRADGVRTLEQHYQLLDLGCLKGQGERFGGLMPAPIFEDWLSASQKPVSPTMPEN